MDKYDYDDEDVGSSKKKGRGRKDLTVLREESKNRQKLLRSQMKDLFAQLAVVIRPPLDPKTEKTKAILQRAIDYITYLHQILDGTGAHRTHGAPGADLSSSSERELPASPYSSPFTSSHTSSPHYSTSSPDIGLGRVKTNDASPLSPPHLFKFDSSGSIGEYTEDNPDIDLFYFQSQLTPTTFTQFTDVPEYETLAAHIGGDAANQSQPQAQQSHQQHLQQTQQHPQQHGPNQFYHPHSNTIIYPYPTNQQPPFNFQQSQGGFFGSSNGGDLSRSISVTSREIKVDVAPVTPSDPAKSNVSQVPPSYPHPHPSFPPQYRAPIPSNPNRPMAGLMQPIPNHPNMHQHVASPQPHHPSSIPNQMATPPPYGASPSMMSPPSQHLRVSPQPPNANARLSPGPTSPRPYHPQFPPPLPPHPTTQQMTVSTRSVSPQPMRPVSPIPPAGLSHDPHVPIGTTRPMEDPHAPRVPTGAAHPKLTVPMGPPHGSTISHHGPTLPTNLPTGPTNAPTVPTHGPVGPPHPVTHSPTVPTHGPMGPPHVPRTATLTLPTGPPPPIPKRPASTSHLVPMGMQSVGTRSFGEIQILSKSQQERLGWVSKEPSRPRIPLIKEPGDVRLQVEFKLKRGEN
eukprot:TRINITY_DN2252_c0_g1_i1.p1 TRINITY_DN2252_c0_g1~~TRINITY_DN2252_c0_g1_i1.p1  ORF type:complete len:626 (-),score=169.81 TRINITY_DN2252_c0_g1_i1:278-2155(-)